VSAVEKEMTRIMRDFDPAPDYAPPSFASPSRSAWTAIAVATGALIDPWAPFLERPWTSSPLRDQFAIASDYGRAITTLAVTHNVPLDGVHPGQGKLFILE
jgi:hypothetical protein